MIIEITTISEALHLKSLCMADPNFADFREFCDHVMRLALLVKYSWIPISPLSP